MKEEDYTEMEEMRGTKKHHYGPRFLPVPKWRLLRRERLTKNMFPNTPQGRNAWYLWCSERHRLIHLLYKAYAHRLRMQTDEKYRVKELKKKRRRDDEWCKKRIANLTHKLLHRGYTVDLEIAGVVHDKKETD